MSIPREAAGAGDRGLKVKTPKGKRGRFPPGRSAKSFATVIMQFDEELSG